MCPRALTLARAHPQLPRAIQPRCHGSGARRLSLFPAPSVAIARNESFTPTRSARTPAVVELAAMPAGEASFAGRNTFSTCAHDEPTGRACLREAAPDARFCRTPRRARGELTKLLWFPGRAREPAWEGDRFRGHHRRQGRFPRPSAKRDTFCCTRGAFHRCAAPFEEWAFTRPRSGVGQLSTCCPQPVEYCCRRLCIPCVSHRCLTTRWDAGTRLPPRWLGP
jgi:hypothetical protein